MIVALGLCMKWPLYMELGGAWMQWFKGSPTKSWDQNVKVILCMRLSQHLNHQPPSLDLSVFIKGLKLQVKNNNNDRLTT
jgi:hypothetical protein